MSAAAASKKTAKKYAGQSHERATAGSVLGPSRLAQVRLRADEVDALQEVMRTLNLGSTSDALREGLRLLAREAAEVGAADELRAFYHGQPAPLPDGVTLVSEGEFEEADNMQW